MVSFIKRKPPRATKPLYRSSKISERVFRQVLEHFAHDRSATDTAKLTGLSLNSVAAIFHKLRVFFFEVGLFMDFYETLKTGGDITLDDEIAEMQLLEFHMQRMAAKRGLHTRSGQPDYHMAESFWRLGYSVMAQQRPIQSIHAVMLSHLLEVIRICGPVGAKPTKRRLGLLAVMRQMDKFALWLERNAPEFKSDRLRQELREIRDIKPDQDIPTHAAASPHRR